ncbi:MAG: fibronectin type III domain-containing protein, partial [Acidimicrobiales bacterium]
GYLDTVGSQFMVHSLSAPLTASEPTSTNGSTTSVGANTVTNLVGGVSTSSFNVASTASFGEIPGRIYVTVATPPGTPTLNSATPGNGTITLGFTDPASNGNSPITGYDAYCAVGTPSTSGTPSGTVSGASASSVTVSDLTDGTNYTCVVTAVNAIGQSPPSNSRSATPLLSGAEPGPYFAVQLTLGSALTHKVGSTSTALTNPDDIVEMGGNLFVAFQNGVGSTGGASSSGNTNSTLVELTQLGAYLGQWDVTGKIDGIGADFANQRIVATVNEDGNSSLYTITPSAPPATAVAHYTYTPSILPSGGGTDSVAIYQGQILISASAPTNSTAPAVYVASLNSTTDVATLSTYFSDNSPATPLSGGSPVTLALTDPDSNAVVPLGVPQVGGDFLLDSQGDQELIFANGSGANLGVLSLNQSVDDTTFATVPFSGVFVTDPVHDTVDEVFGPFSPGEALTSVTPCGSNNAPAACPNAAYPNNYLGVLNLPTGAITPANVAGFPLVTEGMVAIAPGQQNTGGN